MKTYTAQLHDFSGRPKKKWKKTFEKVNLFLEIHAGFQIDFTLVPRVAQDVVWNTVPTYRTNDKTGLIEARFNPYRLWLRPLITNPSLPADFAIGFFSKEQWDRRNPKGNKVAGESIDLVNGTTSEIIFTGREDKIYKIIPEENHDEISGRLLHELGHGLVDHKIGLPLTDLTHHFHYDFGDLAIHYRILRRYM